MAPTRRPRLWDRISFNFPPFDPPQTVSLLCHTSGKLIGRRGISGETSMSRRWLSWLVALLTALGIVLLVNKLACADTPLRRASPVGTVSGL